LFCLEIQNGRALKILLSLFFIFLRKKIFVFKSFLVILQLETRGTPRMGCSVLCAVINNVTHIFHLKKTKKQ